MRNGPLHCQPSQFVAVKSDFSGLRIVLDNLKIDVEIKILKAQSEAEPVGQGDLFFESLFGVKFGTGVSLVLPDHLRHEMSPVRGCVDEHV